MHAARRRTTRVLVVAQVFAGLGQSAAAAGALLALDITGREALATLPLALLIAGAAAAVVPVSALSRRAGRRAGLTTALAAAALGAAGVVAAGALRSFVLLCGASVLFGAGNAAIGLARYAAADLSRPADRGRSIGAVVFATTFGAVAGPNLLAPAGDLAGALGLPPLTGLYLCAAAALLVAALVLFVFLRPDPLRLAVAAGSEPGARSLTPLRQVLGQPTAVTGLAVVVTANFVMVAVMAMAPVQMHDMGAGLSVVGVVVSVHVAGMFAPAPFTGWMTDRLGPLPVATAGAALLMVAGVLAAAGTDTGSMAFGLGLLGVGWNAGLIAGSALLVSALPAAERPRAEAAGELSMGVAAATATALAGPIAGAAGYATLALAGVVAAAALGPCLALVARRGGLDRAVPAQRMLT
jgi:MFS family permease